MKSPGGTHVMRQLLLFLVIGLMAGNMVSASVRVVRCDSLFKEACAKFADGRQADAMDNLFEMLKIAEEEGSDVAAEDKSRACLMLGNIYLGYNDLHNAAKFYEKGLRLSENPEQHLKFAYNLSITYCLLGREKSSRDYHRLLERVEVRNKPLKLYDLAVSEATIEKAFGNGAKSVTLFKHALNLTDSFSLPESKYAIGPLSEISEYYETANRLDSAAYWLEYYERVALDSSYPHAVADSRRGLMRLYIKAGDKEKALEYSGLYMASMDSLVDFKRFITISSKREREREFAAEAHIENLEFTVSKQRAILYSIIGLMTIAGLMWVVVSKFRGNMRQLFARNRELAILEGEINNEEPPGVSEGQWHGLMQRVGAVMDKPENFLDPDFSINTLAALCDSNTRYISQAINETTGDNFRALLNGRRIREARRRLTSDPRFADLTIQSIGESVWFRSASNFINAFKKVTGMTPSLYQKMMKGKSD